MVVSGKRYKNKYLSSLWPRCVSILSKWHKLKYRLNIHATPDDVLPKVIVQKYMFVHACTFYIRAHFYNQMQSMVLEIIIL